MAEGSGCQNPPCILMILDLKKSVSRGLMWGAFAEQKPVNSVKLRSIFLVHLEDQTSRQFAAAIVSFLGFCTVMAFATS